MELNERQLAFFMLFVSFIASVIIILLCKLCMRKIKNKIFPEPPTPEHSVSPTPVHSVSPTPEPDEPENVCGLQRCANSTIGRNPMIGSRHNSSTGLVVYKNSHVKGHNGLTVQVDQEFVPYMDDINEIAKGLRLLFRN